MLSRKNTDNEYKELPVEWCMDLKRTLEEAFIHQLNDQKKRIDIFSELYPDELVIAASLTDQNDQNIMPVTFVISADLESEQRYDHFIDKIIDSIGQFFENYFLTLSWDEYEACWQKLEPEQSLHFRISRENITLSKLADQYLLKK